jgi:hypothetical protein
VFFAICVMQFLILNNRKENLSRDDNDAKGLNKETHTFRIQESDSQLQNMF